jgi:hypothetical protein
MELSIYNRLVRLESKGARKLGGERLSRHHHRRYALQGLFTPVSWPFLTGPHVFGQAPAPNSGRVGVAICGYGALAILPPSFSGYALPSLAVALGVL